MGVQALLKNFLLPPRVRHYVDVTVHWLPNSTVWHHLIYQAKDNKLLTFSPLQNLIFLGESDKNTILPNE